jgi:putative transposase
VYLPVDDMFYPIPETDNNGRKKRKSLAAEFARGIKTEADLNQFILMLTKLTVETALNAELTDHLGYERNTSKKGTNTRNGYTSKTLLSDDGEITRDTPRDREGSFEPQLIKKTDP